MIRISERDKEVTVAYDNWNMVYRYDGNYIILKDGAKFTTGRYDSVISKSYNEMPEKDRMDNLHRDLISWVKKAIDKEVVD